MPDSVFVAYAALLSLAVIAIYAGAWGSLKSPSASAQDDEHDFTERLSSADAYIFPIAASAALFGLYFLFKHLGPEWINWFFAWYFALLGVGSVWKTSAALLRTVLGNQVWQSFEKIHLSIRKGNQESFALAFRSPIPFLLPVAILPSLLFVWAPDKKPVLVTNILALSSAYNALCLLKVDSFQTGTILLLGFFVYDVWWVFGTEVMLNVAKTLDAPVKVLWPKAANFSASKGYALLGLGDIVIPGTFITLGLRRDLWASAHKDPDQVFSKPYFTASLTAYILGLITTITVMHTWQIAQPALLYLSPACILSFLVTATWRGELGDIWKWTDEAQQPDTNKHEPKGPKIEADAQTDVLSPDKVDHTDQSTILEN